MSAHTPARLEALGRLPLCRPSGTLGEAAALHTIQQRQPAKDARAVRKEAQQPERRATCSSPEPRIRRCRLAANDRVEAVVGDGLDLAPAAGEGRYRVGREQTPASGLARPGAGAGVSRSPGRLVRAGVRRSPTSSAPAWRPQWRSPPQRRSLSGRCWWSPCSGARADAAEWVAGHLRGRAQQRAHAEADVAQSGDGHRHRRRAGETRHGPRRFTTRARRGSVRRSRRTSVRPAASHAGQPRAQRVPRPHVHAHLATVPALAVLHEHRASVRVQVGLGQRERFLDP